MLTVDDFRGGAGAPVISGAVHYFRTLPEQWEHRLRMLRAMGASCVETYVPWNLHQRRPDEIDFTGIADLGGFLDLAHNLGLAAVVRPGPYICAEWENGGLPAWLRETDRNAPLRCSDPVYLAAVDAWFEQLIPVIASRQVDRGGNVIAVQVENEYGSYGADARYLRHLVDLLERLDITVALFTSDGPTDTMLTAGTVDGVQATVNFGSRPIEAFDVLKRRRPDDPPWCMEYWNGWFDHWGEPHHGRDAADAADVLDRMLAAGASVNIYMAHGGTNFGTWAGANHEDGYQPTVTSYDYDAPIGEAGWATPKFHAFREVIARYRRIDEEIPEPEPVLTPTTVELTESVPLLTASPREPETTTPMPPRFEELGLDHGLVLYRHRLRGPCEAAELSLPGLADRAQVFVDGRPVATLQRGVDTSVTIEVDDDVDLWILVESMGRVNFGPMLGESKGLLDGVRHGRRFLHGWTAQPIRLDDVDRLSWDEAEQAPGPRFHRGVFTVDEPGDAFLALPEWGNGYVWVNGFCIGRYRAAGPQRTLYVPRPLLHSGAGNEVVVLEMDATSSTTVELRDEPDLG